MLRWGAVSGTQSWNKQLDPLENYQAVTGIQKSLCCYIDFFFKKIGGHQDFCGTIDSPVLEIWWNLAWVSKARWIPCSSLSAYKAFLRSTSDVIPADLLTTSAAAEPFWSTHLLYFDIWVYVLDFRWFHLCASNRKYFPFFLVLDSFNRVLVPCTKIAMLAFLHNF